MVVAVTAAAEIAAAAVAKVVVEVAIVGRTLPAEIK